MAWARIESEPEGLLLEVRALSTWAERLRGLLGTDRNAPPALLLRCGSVHTIGMRYPLDIAFVGERGQVLKICRSVPPGSLRSCKGAYATLERPASHEPWPREGESLWVSAVSAEMSLC